MKKHQPEKEIARYKDEIEIIFFLSCECIPECGQIVNHLLNYQVHLEGYLNLLFKVTGNE